MDKYQVKNLGDIQFNQSSQINLKAFTKLINVHPETEHWHHQSS
jgi:hypothetical protein